MEVKRQYSIRIQLPEEPILKNRVKTITTKDQQLLRDVEDHPGSITEEMSHQTSHLEPLNNPIDHRTSLEVCPSQNEDPDTLKRLLEAREIEEEGDFTLKRLFPCEATSWRSEATSVRRSDFQQSRFRRSDFSKMRSDFLQSRFTPPMSLHPHFLLLMSLHSLFTVLYRFSLPILAILSLFYMLTRTSTLRSCP